MYHLHKSFVIPSGARNLFRQHLLRKVFILGMLLTFTFLLASAAAQPPLQAIVVEAEGVAELGASREQAVRAAQHHALIQAVETACGVRVAGLEVGRDGALQLSARLAFAQGVVQRWTPLGEPQVSEGRVRVRIRAEVLPTTELTTAADWREVWRAVGHPPIGLHLQYTGELGLETPTREALQRLLQDSLNAMGAQLSEIASANAWRLVAEARLTPLKRWGDADAPYETGDLFASWRVSLTLSLMPPANAPRIPLSATATPLTLLQGEAIGVSHTSDADAVGRALQKILAQHNADAWRTQIAQAWVNYLLYAAQPSPQSTTKEVKKNATNAATRTLSNNRKPAAARANRH